MTPLDMDCQSDGCLFATAKTGMRTQDGRCRCLERPGARMKLGRFMNEARALEAEAEQLRAQVAELEANICGVRHSWAPTSCELQVGHRGDHQQSSRYWKAEEK